MRRWVAPHRRLHHQGAIDWPTAAADDIDFVWIKATEGGDWTDRRFADDRTRAEAAGLRWGACHFFTFRTPAADQAGHFLATVPPGADLPPALDVEYGGNCARRPEWDTLGREVDVFLDRVEAETGRRPLVYVTEELMADHPGMLDDEVVWARSLLHPVRWGTRARVDVWQWANIGRVAGIEGRVDRNSTRRWAVSRPG